MAVILVVYMKQDRKFVKIIRQRTGFADAYKNSRVRDLSEIADRNLKRDAVTELSNEYKKRKEHIFSDTGEGDRKIIAGDERFKMKRFDEWLGVAAVIFICGAVSFAKAGPVKRVLIVAEKEILKDPVVSKVRAALKKDGYGVSVTAKKKLKDKTAKKFGAVLVVNRTGAGQKVRGVKMFLSRSEQKKIVLFNAVGSSYWLSADKTDESEKIAGSILKNIRAVLETVEPKH